MALCSVNDIALIFGWRNVTQWSQLEGDQNVQDIERIEKAIDVSSETIENMFQGITLPEDSMVVTDWCARLSGIWLFTGRISTEGNELAVAIERMHKQVMDDMIAYKGSGLPNFTPLNAVGVWDEDEEEEDE